jgi:hypothetical protein
MKTLLTLIIFSFISITNAKAQNIDTVLVRNLQLQSGDWAWLAGKYPYSTDSVTLRGLRRIRSAVQANIPPNYTTNLTIDSLPGIIVNQMYFIVKNAPAGEIVSRYTAITSAISAKTNMAYFVGLIDGAMNAAFLRTREIGKNILIDQ